MKNYYSHCEERSDEAIFINRDRHAPTVPSGLAMTRKQCGQSILEVLIALTLIIIFLSGVIVVQLFAVRNVNYSQNKSKANQLARQQLDRVKVVRDSAGIDALTVCQSSCFINSQLTPVQGVTPTGIFDQVVTLSAVSILECPLPDITITPTPVSYKVTAKIILKNTAISTTPTPMTQIQSCITDWR